MKTIGETIAVLRKEHGFTQEMLASAIGVSAQSISKWENNTTMPDIMLLPILADTFQTTVDALFGRQSARDPHSADEVFDLCCETMLDMVMSCLYHPDTNVPYEQAQKQYKHSLDSDNRIRTGVIRKHGIVYYRKEIGGLLLKKPETHWHTLLGDAAALETLELLSNEDFCLALTEIIKNRKKVFTIASLCNSCNIEDAASLEETIQRSRLFERKSIDIDGQTVFVYELVQGQRLFLLFAVFTYAAEYSRYEDIYSGYYGDGSYYSA